MPRCTLPTDDQWAICATCHRMLPDNLRNAITRTFAPGLALETGITLETATPGLQRAIAAAHSWLVATFADSPGRSADDPGRWERLVRSVRSRDDARRARAGAKPESTEEDSKPPRPFRHLRLVP